MSANVTAAVVGAVGGAGTTRLTVESGATLARAGYDVAVLDAAFATQGLAEYVPGRIETDLTRLHVDEGDLPSALYELECGDGRLSLCPTHAPFERLARAKTAGAAERFESRIGEAALSHEIVLVDTPPVAANQAVAAVTACDRVAVVTPDTDRGGDGLARTRARIADLGTDVDAVVANFADDDRAVTEAAAAVPTGDVTSPSDCPTCTDSTATLGPSVAAAVETVVGVDLDLAFEEGGRLDGLLG